MQLEGLGLIEKSNDLIGNRTSDLPDCSFFAETSPYLVRSTTVGATGYATLTALPRPGISTAAIMTPCRSERARRFGEKYHFRLHGEDVSQAQLVPCFC
jgi:hypothetical protein